jgi:hypothetical protein
MGIPQKGASILAQTEPDKTAGGVSGGEGPPPPPPPPSKLTEAGS